MTDSQKKMKKYTNAVERRLNLPREVKNRVMSDFISAISARREAGMTDEEIFAELGSPKEAAEAMNEQMKEYTYRKSPWRFAFLALALYEAYKLLGLLAGRLAMLFFIMDSTAVSAGESASIGIIGGADGPTAIFVTGSPLMSVGWAILLLILGITGYILLRNRK